VLIEGPSKRDASVPSGRTGQNKLVHVAAPASTALPAGTVIEARITRAAPHFLAGDMVAVTARPRHRVRIPVVAV
jgi:tRNA A37 methylthiotransferase MiaB